MVIANKGDTVFYVQIFPTLKYGAILELTVRSTSDTGFTATDLSTKKSYYLSNNQDNIFGTMLEAKNYFDKAVADGLIPEQKATKRRRKSKYN